MRPTTSLIFLPIISRQFLTLLHQKYIAFNLYEFLAIRLAARTEARRERADRAVSSRSLRSHLCLPPSLLLSQPCSLCRFLFLFSFFALFFVDFCFSFFAKQLQPRRPATPLCRSSCQHFSCVAA